jgi:hypothetical protein
MIVFRKSVIVLVPARALALKLLALIENLSQHTRGRFSKKAKTPYISLR